MRIDDRLEAGEIVVRPTMSEATRSRMGQSNTVRRDFEMVAVPGPWGTLRVILDGLPANVRTEIDSGVIVALQALTASDGLEGPIATSTTEDCPLTYGTETGGLRFVSRGSRLRLGGRYRYLRATAGDRTWTFGMPEAAFTKDGDAERPWGKGIAPLELRRGPKTGKGEKVAEIRIERNPEKAGTVRQRVAWDDGAQLGEVALLLTLWLGTKELKLHPFWGRALMFWLNN